MKYELFPAEELQPGQMRAARVGSVNVVVLRDLGGEYHALRDVCAHLGARLSHGVLEKMVQGDDVGERELSNRLVIRCPWHGFEFDAATGRCPADPTRVRVRAYTVNVENGTLVLDR